MHFLQTASFSLRKKGHNNGSVQGRKGNLRVTMDLLPFASLSCWLCVLGHVISPYDASVASPAERKWPYRPLGARWWSDVTGHRDHTWPSEGRRPVDAHTGRSLASPGPRLLSSLLLWVASQSPTGGVAQFEVPVPKLRKTGKRCGIAVVNKVCVLCQYFHISFKNWI